MNIKSKWGSARSKSFGHHTAAEGFTVHSMPPFVIVCGPPASGKTVLAAALSAELGLPVVSKDLLKEANYDIATPIDQREFAASATSAGIGDRVERDSLRMTFASNHYPIEVYFVALEKAGFSIEALREGRVDDASTEAEPGRERWLRLPLFLNLRAVKN